MAVWKRRGFPRLGVWRRVALGTAVALSVPALGAARENPPPTDAFEYQIGAGDVLQLFVWKERELTRQLTVRLDGKVTIPLLGDVEAAGRTPQELGTDLTQRLTRFIEGPQVSVAVDEAKSIRFYVIGQVNNSGAFPLTGRTSVLQGLALAGGFREFAKTDGIMIVRREGAREAMIPFNYKRLESGKDISQNIALRPGDTILVP